MSKNAIMYPASVIGDTIDNIKAGGNLSGVGMLATGVICAAGLAVAPHLLALNGIAAFVGSVGRAAGNRYDPLTSTIHTDDGQVLQCGKKMTLDEAIDLC